MFASHLVIQGRVGLCTCPFSLRVTSTRRGFGEGIENRSDFVRQFSLEISLADFPGRNGEARKLDGA